MSVILISRNDMNAVRKGASTPGRRVQWTAALLLLLVGCSGCGKASAKPLLMMNSEGILESPLPPITVDAKTLKTKSSVLYGRVVVDGKPAKKGTVMVVAISIAAMEQDPSLRQPVGIVRRRTPDVDMAPVKDRAAGKPTYSCSVIRDDGLYLLKGLAPGEYKLACHFSPSFQGKVDPLRAARYSDPTLSAIQVTITEGELMQDVVMNIAPAAN